MNTPDEFDQMMGREFATPTTSNAPYGQPVKPGLTPRGKAGIAISAVVLAGGGLLFWQHTTEVSAANEAKAQQIQLEKERLELEKLKALNEAAKTNTTGIDARQKQINACVDSNKDLIGKSVASRLQDIVGACQAQYTNPTATGGDMQAAASSSNSGTGKGSVNDGVLIGGLAIAGIVAFTVRRSTRSNEA
ncbi:hypothetical protein [Streptomyces sp. NPDC003395]